MSKPIPCKVSGCIAVVDAEGDLCRAHYDSCHVCGFARRMHPVVQFTGDGPILRCSVFAHQGMDLSPKFESAKEFLSATTKGVE